MVELNLAVVDVQDVVLMYMFNLCSYDKHLILQWRRPMKEKKKIIKRRDMHE